MVVGREGRLHGGHGCPWGGALNRGSPALALRERQQPLQHSWVLQEVLDRDRLASEGLLEAWPTCSAQLGVQRCLVVRLLLRRLLLRRLLLRRLLLRLLLQLLLHHRSRGLLCSGVLLLLQLCVVIVVELLVVLLLLLQLRECQLTLALGKRCGGSLLLLLVCQCCCLLVLVLLLLLLVCKRCGLLLLRQCCCLRLALFQGHHCRLLLRQSCGCLPLPVCNRRRRSLLLLIGCQNLRLLQQRGLSSCGGLLCLLLLLLELGSRAS